MLSFSRWKNSEQFQDISHQTNLETAVAFVFFSMFRNWISKCMQVTAKFASVLWSKLMLTVCPPWRSILRRRCGSSVQKLVWQIDACRLTLEKLQQVSVFVYFRGVQITFHVDTLAPGTVGNLANLSMTLARGRVSFQIPLVMHKGNAQFRSQNNKCSLGL